MGFVVVIRTKPITEEANYFLLIQLATGVDVERDKAMLGERVNGDAGLDQWHPPRQSYHIGVEFRGCTEDEWW